MGGRVYTGRYHDAVQQYDRLKTEYEQCADNLFPTDYTHAWYTLRYGDSLPVTLDHDQ